MNPPEYISGTTLCSELSCRTTASSGRPQQRRRPSTWTRRWRQEEEIPGGRRSRTDTSSTPCTCTSTAWPARAEWPEVAVDYTSWIWGVARRARQEEGFLYLD
uniref:Uncharacterized protein n=1 Tax=Timema shepardi TaxID=629360 RepID=A0A7R9BAB8_TIMSH|nr:unnamed protein product [Timema shepardi]